ncbi:SIR2 family protein [Accumulibacter sp.]|uniref:SIR2 family protein n=1 Tax=Accumulibacter sp. TaxID=2053492 RepID=UPI002620B150|nr:SIR2 family protein [Accumulibacter sp.]
MKIGPCDFPEPLLAALRDNRLVVFAGAGVSRGAPANLPDFARLAERIADGTGEVRSRTEPEDRFLGRLKDRGVEVHSRAAQVLSGETTAPTPLHRDLLRLFPAAERLRIVTTNYDQLFELAASDVFGEATPVCFRAPALPLGSCFNGVVHVHGEITRPAEMVLTDADFGRGYLVEGWARRFLLDLFRQFTVLFVGYSHNDLIVSYLARALPETQAGQRFALTGASDDFQRWRVLGIEPIGYSQSSRDDHSALYAGVRCLADAVTRSVLDWQREVTELAQRQPPLSDEEAGTIDYALKETSTTRFFTEAARLPEWLDWLDKRGHLVALFQDAGRLSDRDKCLARWLASNFAASFSDHFFALIASHKMRLHPEFWFDLGRELALADVAPIPRSVWLRWISVLLSTAPAKLDADVFLWLGQRSIQYDALDELLLIFDRMTRNRLVLTPRFTWPPDADSRASLGVDADSEWCAEHPDGLDGLWERGLRPNLVRVAESLLRQIISRLEEQHAALRVWQEPGSDLDWTSIRRRSIEPDEDADRCPEVIDILINAARDCLGWLAENRAMVAGGWCDQLSKSDAVLLRRLAVFTLTARADLPADDKLDWLLTHIGLHEAADYAEIFKAVHAIYPATSREQREVLIAAVLAYRSLDEEDPNWEWNTVKEQYEWLKALHGADDTCALARQALNDLLARCPELKESELSDSSDWGGSVVSGRHTPWTEDELLSRPPAGWLPDLLAFQGITSHRSDRYGLLRTVSDAAKKNFPWSMGLAHELADAGEWAADLWPVLLHAWSEMALEERDYLAVFNVLGRIELCRHHQRAAVGTLYALVEGGGKPFALTVLLRANEIAAALWSHLDCDEDIENDGAWLQSAVERPAGVLAKFWVGSLVLWRKQQETLPTSLNGEYRRALSVIVDDPKLPGRLGRCVLTSRLGFFMGADEIWTREHLVPLFSAVDRYELEAAWNGFLTLGRLNPQLGELLGDVFLQAVQRLDGDLANQRLEFVEYYTEMLLFYVSDPFDRWLSRFFRHGCTATRRFFAATVKRNLRRFDDRRRSDLWDRWLKRYWKSRLHGVPAALERGEVEEMLEWLPLLSAVFEDAVGLAVGMPQVKLRHCSVVPDLESGDLPTQYPAAVARLLIWLAATGSPSYLWHSGRRLTDTLLSAGLPADLEHKVRELVAELGLR